MTKNKTKIVLATSTLLALLVGGTMMHIAWKHNAQSEIHSNGTIDWFYWITIGFSWAIPTFILFCLIGFGIKALTRKT